MKCEVCVNNNFIKIQIYLTENTLSIKNISPLMLLDKTNGLESNADPVHTKKA